MLPGTYFCSSSSKWAGQPCRACTGLVFPCTHALCIPSTKRLATSGDVCAIFYSTLAQCLPLRTTGSISTPAHTLLCLLFCACTVFQRLLFFAVSNAVALGLMHTVSQTHVSRSRAPSPSLSLTLSLSSLSWPLMYTHTHAHTHTHIFPLTHA